MRNTRSLNTMLLFMGIIILISSLAVAGTMEKSKPDPSRILMSKARTAGSVPVIIRFRVPDMDALLSESLKYPSFLTSRDEYQLAQDADLRLEMAVRTVTDELLFELGKTNFRLHHTFTTLPLLAIEATPEALDSLNKMPNILGVVEDRVIKLPDYQVSNLKSDPTASPQMNEAAPLIGADMAWSVGFTGENWYVAVLDSGIRRTHEAFKGKTIVEQCYSLRGDCPNGQREMAGPGSSAHYDSKYWGYDHGTHVSGIAAGHSVGGFSGIAPGADIINIQVFSRFSAVECNDNSPCVMSYNSDQLKGLEFLFNKRNVFRIAAVNMSLGGGSYSSASACDLDNPMMKIAIDNLRNAGIPTIISSGNEGICDGISAPACISSAIAIGATSKSDVESSFSNFHPALLDFFAPGSSIRSSTGGSNASYESWGGTSMASPMVTGAFALLRQFSDQISLDDLLKTMNQAGKSVETKCLTGDRKPRINVGEALLSLMTVVPPTNISGEQSKNQSVFQSEYLNTLTWEANPLNDDKNVVAYRVYLVENGELFLLSEVSADVFSYRHRRVAKRTPKTYAFSSIDGEGEESLPAYYELSFGVEQ